MEENVSILLEKSDTSALKVNYKQHNDSKVHIKLYNGSSILGQGDFIILDTSIVKRENTYQKWITLSTPSSTTGGPRKSAMANNLINTIKIFLKAKFQYTDKENGSVLETDPKSELETVVKEFKNDKSKIISAGDTKKKLNSRQKNLSAGDVSNFGSGSKRKNVSTSQTPTPSQRNQNQISHVYNTLNTMASVTSPKINTSKHSSPNTKKTLNFNNKKQTKKSSLNSKDEYTAKILQTEGHDLKKIKKQQPERPKSQISSKEPKETLHQALKEQKESKIKIMDKQEKSSLSKLPQIKKDFTDPALSNHQDTTCISAVENNNFNSQNDQGENNEELDLTNSFIDQVFVNDSDPLLNSIKFDSTLAEFRTYYTSDLLNVLPDDEMYLKFEAKMLIEKVLELMELYYQDYKELLNRYSQYKHFLKLYAEKYSLFNKKINKLKENLENNKIRNTFIGFLWRQENAECSENFALQKKEINLFSTMMCLESTNNLDVENYIKSELEKKQSEKTKIMEIAAKIFSNEETYNKLSDNVKHTLNTILSKNGISLSFNEIITPKKEEKTTISSIGNYYSNDQEEPLIIPVTHERNVSNVTANFGNIGTLNFNNNNNLTMRSTNNGNVSFSASETDKHSLIEIIQESKKTLHTLKPEETFYQDDLKKSLQKKEFKSLKKSKINYI